MRTCTLLALGLAVPACQRAPLNIATPEPVADSITISADRQAATAAILHAIDQEAWPLRLFDPAAGLVETDYADLAARFTEFGDLEASDRYVRFRFMVRSADHTSTVAVQIIHNPFYPNSIPRRMERAVPVDHPAYRLLDRMLARLAEQVTSD